MAGQVELDEVMPASPGNERIREEALSFDREIRKRMSPAGALGLPELLDQRRLEYGITDGAFAGAVLFDRVYVFQISDSDHEGGFFGKDSRIVTPDQTRDRLKHEAPRGILIGAGLRALDILRSHGVDLGHIVHFINSQPWRLYVDMIAGKRIPVLPMNAGDILDSEDLARELRPEGRAVVRKNVNPEGAIEHAIAFPGEVKLRKPIQPWVSDDSI